MAGAEPRPFDIFRLRDGTRVSIRPACPWDAVRIQDYVRGLAPSSRYTRFLGALNELAPGDLDRIRKSDDRHATLVVEAGGAGTRVVIAEARYAAAPDAADCEIALSVADAWRGRGVGTLLLDFLECRARGRGARTLVADVLRSNAAMRTLARKAGFATTNVPADARLVRIVKDISAARVGTPCAQVMRSRLPIAA
jgi:GNAT superfamily N-acetyltransferase